MCAPGTNVSVSPAPRRVPCEIVLITAGARKTARWRSAARGVAVADQEWRSATPASSSAAGSRHPETADRGGRAGRA